MHPSTFQDIVRFGITILAATYLLAMTSEGASAMNADYAIVKDYNVEPKPRSKPREIRGFKPHSMSTAIGFGKRQSNPSSMPSPDDKTIVLPLREFSERLLKEWFIQVFKMRLERESKPERNSLSNEENTGPSVMRRNNNKINDDPSYYDE